MLDCDARRGISRSLLGLFDLQDMHVVLWIDDNKPGLPLGKELLLGMPHGDILAINPDFKRPKRLIGVARAVLAAVHQEGPGSLIGTLILSVVEGFHSAFVGACGNFIVLAA